MNDIGYVPEDPQPFWFIDLELAGNFLHAEIAKVNGLIEECPQIRSSFDVPESTVSQRGLCFTLLAHRKVLDVIYDRFASLYEDSPSLGEEESRALQSTNGLVTADAPDWTLEMNRVAELLPSHIFTALPQPLRAGGYNTNDPAQMKIIESAADSLRSLESLQTLIDGVIDQQLARLTTRWSVPVTAREAYLPQNLPKKRKGHRTRDKVRAARDREIAEIDSVSETPAEFLRLMDERRIKPQPTWSRWPGSWQKAYQDSRLRPLIHQDKSRALARARRHR